MRLRNAFAAGLVLFTLAAPIASAQVVGNGPVNGLGTFRDLGTNRTWLRLDNFFDQSPFEMVAVANAAGFTVATLADVLQLWNSLPIDNGEWLSYKSIIGDAPNRELYWGMYDTGSTDEQGWGYAYDNQTSWTDGPVAATWNEIPNAGGQFADMNLWAFQTTTTVPEPSSLILLGSGALAIFVVRRRTRKI